MPSEGTVPSNFEKNHLDTFFSKPFNPMSTFLYHSAKLQSRNRPRSYEILDFIYPCIFSRVPCRAMFNLRRVPCREIARHISVNKCLNLGTVSSKNYMVYKIKYFIAPTSISRLQLGRAVKDKPKILYKMYVHIMWISVSVVSILGIL